MPIWKFAEIAEHPSWLYRSDSVAEGVSDLESVTDDHIHWFHQHGFLVIDRAFSATEVHRTMLAVMDMVTGRNAAFDPQTVFQYEASVPSEVDTMSPEERLDCIRKVWLFVQCDPRFREIYEHPQLIGLLTRLMGERPVLFQDMALLKPPRIGGEKPWHQDCAYFDSSPDATIVGVWIALDEATAENGCMHVIPGSHRRGPVMHFQRRDWQICDTEVAVKEQVIVPLRPGGCLLFHGLLHHGTPSNHSPERRRALQLHYKPASTKAITREQRMAIFGSEGKDVQC